MPPSGAFPTVAAAARESGGRNIRNGGATPATGKIGAHDALTRTPSYRDIAKEHTNSNGRTEPSVEHDARLKNPTGRRHVAASSDKELESVDQNVTRSGPAHIAVLPGIGLETSQMQPRQRSPLHMQQQQQRLPDPDATSWHDARDEDEVAGVVGAVRHYQPFQNPEVAEPLPEINIAVVGAEGVGKSTFIQKALDLPHASLSQAAERKVPVDGNVYLVRLLELPLQEIDIDDDDKINWPDTIDDKMMPRIDGALTLYDVGDKSSIDELPEMMSAMFKVSLPTILISCKCDAPLSECEIDPSMVERGAKRALAGLTTLRTSNHSSETHKAGISMLLKAIIGSRPEGHFRSSSATRRRAQSNAVRPVSPRTPNHFGHSRASSEFTGGLRKDHRHTRHDSSIAGYSSSDRLRVPTDDHGQGSFLLEESPSEEESVRSSIDVDSIVHSLGNAQGSFSLSENGATFDELVDRLLSQPTSKADGKFASIFLALYRKFAAPGRLLEAVIARFDAIVHDNNPQVTKTIEHARYATILEQWVGIYPGDFAFPRTKRRLRTFITRLSQMPIFAVAAKEISNSIDAAQEDDDTEWAYCDRDRDTYNEPSRLSLSSTVSTLIDDPALVFAKELSGSTLSDDPPSFTTDSTRSVPILNQMMAYVGAAQKQAELLHPIPRNPITKPHWRELMEQSDDVIARELTRIDWIMFSAIRPRDLVRHVSLSATQKEKCKDLIHVNRMIDRFNQLACWVANFILLRDKPKHRALMLEKFIRIARKLRDLNNYNSLGAVIAGVKSTAVHRLTATRELISPALGRDWLKLEVLMGPSKSFATYRLAWVNSSNERIPYLPLHRRDLVSAEEGNKTFVDDDKDGRINWRKFEIMGEVIVSMQRAQGMPYRNLGSSKENEQIRELILDVKLVKDEEELYERSLQCEPAASTSGITSAKFREFFKR